jgi:predicted dehydrogenase
MVKQCEKHGGPYSPWFWQPEEAGGGILMDMGCHSIEFCRWFMGKPKVKSVFAHMNTYVHSDKTKEEDHVIVLIEFEGGEIALCESSWALQGGMDSIMEVTAQRRDIRGPAERNGAKGLQQKGI